MMEYVPGLNCTPALLPGFLCGAIQFTLPQAPTRQEAIESRLLLREPLVVLAEAFLDGLPQRLLGPEIGVLTPEALDQAASLDEILGPARATAAQPSTTRPPWTCVR